MPEPAGPSVAGEVNRQVRLRRRPSGLPTPDDFEIVEVPVPSPGEGEFLCRTLYLSLDPYMRLRMNEGRSYAPSVALGGIMVGGTVSRVVASRHPDFAPGDFVQGANGWQEYAVSRGTGVRTLDPAVAPLSTALGVLGMPGMTAYVGLLDIGRPRPGETVVVAAAAGAVGSVVGQIAKIKGCRAVGIAGSAEKCRWVVEEAGFDACLNHRTEDLHAGLRRACPEGIDVYFENVGGEVLKAVLRLLNVGARIPLCGLIAHYNDPEPAPGPSLASLLANRVLLKGFIVSDHADRTEAFLADCTRWLREGRLRHREDVVQGLEQAPAALAGLLQGRNFGKLLVRVSSEEGAE